MKLKTNLRAGSLGLGDAIAEFTHLTGLDNLATAYTQITGKDCGCNARRKFLNQF